MKGLTALLTVALLAATPSAAQDAENGAALYAQYCATCHGAEATGGGPMAPVLVLQPPDLTQLSERNDGVFPVVRVVMRIDGRDPLVSHGSPMPVYGPYFESDLAVPLRSESGQPILASPEIVDLVAFLEGLQP
ncbi:MAG: cytochrome c [Pseudomonadota bacterium]